MDNVSLILMVLGAVGTMILAFILWILQEHMAATKQNTVAIAVLTAKFDTFERRFLG